MSLFPGEKKERGRASKPNFQNQWGTNNESERKTWMKRGSVSMRGCECEQCAVVLTTSSDTVAHVRFSDRKQWRFDGKWVANNKLSKSPCQSFRKKRNEECWVRAQAVILTPEELFLMLFTVFQSKQHDLCKKKIWHDHKISLRSLNGEEGHLKRGIFVLITSKLPTSSMNNNALWR